MWSFFWFPVCLLNQLQIFLQLYLIELLWFLTGLGLLELQHLIYPRLFIGLDMHVSFTNLSLMEFQVRYLALFILHKNIQLMLDYLEHPSLVLHFSYFTLMTILTILSAILIYILMILLSVLNVIRHLICGNNLNWLLNLNLIFKTLETGGKKWLVDFNTGKENSAGFVLPV